MQKTNKKKKNKNEYKKYNIGIRDAWAAVTKFVMMNEETRMNVFGYSEIEAFVINEEPLDAIKKIKKYDKEYTDAENNNK